MTHVACFNNCGRLQFSEKYSTTCPFSPSSGTKRRTFPCTERAVVTARATEPRKMQKFSFSKPQSLPPEQRRSKMKISRPKHEKRLEDRNSEGDLSIDNDLLPWEKPGENSFDGQLGYMFSAAEEEEKLDSLVKK